MRRAAIAREVGAGGCSEVRCCKGVMAAAGVALEGACVSHSLDSCCAPCSAKGVAGSYIRWVITVPEGGATARGSDARHHGAIRVTATAASAWPAAGHCGAHRAPRGWGRACLEPPRGMLRCVAPPGRPHAHAHTRAPARARARPHHPSRRHATRASCAVRLQLRARVRCCAEVGTGELSAHCAPCDFPTICASRRRLAGGSNGTLGGTGSLDCSTKLVLQLAVPGGASGGTEYFEVRAWGVQANAQGARSASCSLPFRNLTALRPLRALHIHHVPGLCEQR